MCFGLVTSPCEIPFLSSDDFDDEEMLISVPPSPLLPTSFRC